jgi:hypothetical protein
VRGQRRREERKKAAAERRERTWGRLKPLKRLKEAAGFFKDLVISTPLVAEAANVVDYSIDWTGRRINTLRQMNTKAQEAVGLRLDAGLRWWEEKGKRGEAAGLEQLAKEARQKAQELLEEAKAFLNESGELIDVTGDGVVDERDEREYKAKMAKVAVKEAEAEAYEARAAEVLALADRLKDAGRRDIRTSRDASLLRRLVGKATRQRPLFKPSTRLARLRARWAQRGGEADVAGQIFETPPAEPPTEPPPDDETKPPGKLRLAGELVRSQARAAWEALRHPRQTLEARRQRNNEYFAGLREQWTRRFNLDTVDDSQLDQWLEDFNNGVLVEDLDSDDPDTRRAAEQQQAKQLMALLLNNRIACALGNREYGRALDAVGVDFRAVRDAKEHEWYENVRDQGGARGVLGRFNIQLFNFMQNLLPVTIVDVDRFGRRNAVQYPDEEVSGLLQFLDRHNILKLQISPTRESRTAASYTGYATNLLTAGALRYPVRLAVAAGLTGTNWAVGRLQESDLQYWEREAAEGNIRAQAELALRRFCMSESSLVALRRVTEFFLGTRHQEGFLGGAAAAQRLLAIIEAIELAMQEANASEGADDGRGTRERGEERRQILVEEQREGGGETAAEPGTAATTGTEAGTATGPVTSRGESTQPAIEGAATGETVAEGGLLDRSKVPEAEAETTVASPTPAEAIQRPALWERIRQREAKFLKPKAEGLSLAAFTEAERAFDIGGIVWNHYNEVAGDPNLANLLTRMTRGLADNQDVDYTRLGPNSMVTVFNDDTIHRLTDVAQATFAKVDAAGGSKAGLNAAELLMMSGKEGSAPFAFAPDQVVQVLENMTEGGR